VSFEMCMAAKVPDRATGIVFEIHQIYFLAVKSLL
jgi:hypothetical protein